MKGLVDELGFQLSKNQVEHTKEFIKIKPTPTPKILIKDQKKSNIKGGLQMRLIVPETFFDRYLLR